MNFMDETLLIRSLPRTGTFRMLEKDTIVTLVIFFVETFCVSWNCYISYNTDVKGRSFLCTRIEVSIYVIPKDGTHPSFDSLLTLVDSLKLYCDFNRSPICLDTSVT